MHDRSISCGTEFFALAIIVAVATAFRFWNLNWDQGFLLHPDEFNLVAASSRLKGYGSNPDFFAYNGLGLFLPRIATEVWSLLTWTDVNPRSLSTLSYASRFISAFLSTATVVLAWRVARVVFGPSVGLLAASLFALDVASIQSAHFGTTESALNFIEMVVFLVAVLFMTDRATLNQFILTSASLIGAGLAIKTSALTLALIPIVATTGKLREIGALRILYAALLSLTICLVMFVILSPHSIKYIGSFLDTMRFERGVVTGDEDVYWTWQFIDQPRYLFPLSQFAWLCNPLTAGIGLGGIVIVVFEAVFLRVRSARLFLPLVLFVIVQFMIVGGWHAKFVRYLMPCVPGILFGAVFILARAGEERRRTAFIVGAALLTASSGIWATAYSSIYRHEDSRVTASTWLLRRIKENQLILREPRDNPLPLPITPSPKFQIRDLQLYEQSPQAAATLLARDLADGDWLIIASRRNRGTLPRLYKRFPLACFYYRELFQGELGYELVRTFANEPAFFGLTVPTRYAEETFQVFDHPTTTVFRNTGKKSATDIRDRLLSKFELKSCSPDQIN